MATSDDTDHVEVGALTAYFTKGSLPTFWFTHDLAELFELEYNSDAEEKLRSSIGEKPRGRLAIDHEADAVTVRASNAELMTHVLHVVRRLSRSESSVPTEDIAKAA